MDLEATGPGDEQRNRQSPISPKAADDRADGQVRGQNDSRRDSSATSEELEAKTVAKDREIEDEVTTDTGDKRKDADKSSYSHASPKKKVRTETTGEETSTAVELSCKRQGREGNSSESDEGVCAGSPNKKRCAVPESTEYEFATENVPGEEVSTLKAGRGNGSHTGHRSSSPPRPPTNRSFIADDHSSEPPTNRTSASSHAKDKNASSLVAEKGTKSQRDDKGASSPTDDRISIPPTDEKTISLPIENKGSSSKTKDRSTSSPEHEKITGSAMDDACSGSVVDDNSTSSAVDGKITGSAMDDACSGSVVDDNSTSSAVDGKITGSAMDDACSGSVADDNSTSSAVDEKSTCSSMDDARSSCLVDVRSTNSLMGGACSRSPTHENSTSSLPTDDESTISALDGSYISTSSSTNTASLDMTDMTASERLSREYIESSESLTDDKTSFSPVDDASESALVYIRNLSTKDERHTKPAPPSPPRPPANDTIDVSPTENTGDNASVAGTGSIPPVGDTGDNPSVSNTGDIPPVAGASDILPVAGTGNIPPNGDATDIPPACVSGDVPLMGFTHAITPVGDTGDIPPVDVTSDIPPIMVDTGDLPLVSNISSVVDTSNISPVGDTGDIPPVDVLGDIPLNVKGDISPVDHTGDIPPVAYASADMSPVAYTGNTPLMGGASGIPPAGYAGSISVVGETGEILPFGVSGDTPLRGVTDAIPPVDVTDATPSEVENKASSENDRKLQLVDITKPAASRIMFQPLPSAPSADPLAQQIVTNTAVMPLQPGVHYSHGNGTGTSEAQAYPTLSSTNTIPDLSDLGGLPMDPETDVDFQADVDLSQAAAMVGPVLSTGDPFGTLFETSDVYGLLGVQGDPHGGPLHPSSSLSAPAGRQEQASGEVLASAPDEQLKKTFLTGRVAYLQKCLSGESFETDIPSVTAQHRAPTQQINASTDVLDYLLGNPFMTAQSCNQRDSSTMESGVTHSIPSGAAVLGGNCSIPHCPCLSCGRRPAVTLSREAVERGEVASGSVRATDPSPRRKWRSFSLEDVKRAEVESGSGRTRLHYRWQSPDSAREEFDVSHQAKKVEEENKRTYRNESGCFGDAHPLAADCVAVTGFGCSSVPQDRPPFTLTREEVDRELKRGLGRGFRSYANPETQQQRQSERTFQMPHERWSDHSSRSSSTYIRPSAMAVSDPEVSSTTPDAGPNPLETEDPGNTAASPWSSGHHYSGAQRDFSSGIGLAESSPDDLGKSNPILTAMLIAPVFEHQSPGGVSPSGLNPSASTSGPELEGSSSHTSASNSPPARVDNQTLDQSKRVCETPSAIPARPLSASSSATSCSRTPRRKIRQEDLADPNREGGQDSQPSRYQNN